MIVINYQDKYKDRKPEETIKIIQKFFKDKGLKVIEGDSQKTEIGTWWVSLKLYYKNFLLLRSNGKGMTKQFSRASGYAELYERFCNASNEMYATIAYQDIKKERYKKYGYYLSKDEKQLTFQEATQSSFRIKYKFDLMNDYENNLEKVYNLAFDNRLIGVPYIKLDNINEKKYLMPEIVQATTGSDGMAAGNTLEEALVQGISEIYEHIVWNKVYENISEPTPELSFKKLKLPKSLKIKGEKIYNLGYDFKIFDYSYLYNMPVIGVLLINQKEYNYSLILGASPVFEIALERCFTEIYQGFLTQKEKIDIITPIKNMSNILYYQYQHFGSLSCRNCYNEQQFYNTIQFNNYNKDIFINTNCSISNYELLKYYIKLAQKLNLEFYYCDNSQLKNFFAVHVYLDNYIIFPHMHYQFIQNKDNNELKKECLIFLQNFIKSTIQYLKNSNFNEFNNLFYKYKDKFCTDLNFYNLIFDYLYYIPDIFSFYIKDDNFLNLFFKALNGKNPNYYFNSFLNDKKIYHFINQYYQNNKIIKEKTFILILLSQNNYNKKEIEKIFYNIFNNKTINLNLNKLELFKDIFLLNLKENNDYQNYIKIMTR